MRRAKASVTQAVRRGHLLRGACDECGDVAEAHHDSYFPDCWLKVRWLCKKHHEQWHIDNKPIYPPLDKTSKQAESGTREKR